MSQSLPAVIFEEQLCFCHQTQGQGYRLQPSQATLTTDELTWWENDQTHTLALADTVGVNVLPKHFQQGMAGFEVHTYPLVRVHRWSQRRRRVYRVYQFVCASVELRSQWLQAMEQVLHPEQTQKSPPRHLVILLNPVSGRKQAWHIFQTIRPVLEQAHLHLTVIETQGEKRTQIMITTMELSTIDGFVIIGGDGTIHDTINGLMARKDWHSAIQIPIGVIPAGTGNGLSKTLLEVSGEPDDALSATFLIAKGKQRSLDLVAVEQEGHRFFSMLSLSWAIVSQADIGSEKLRWLGPLRLDIYGIVEILRLRRYRGKLSLLLHPESPQATTEAGQVVIEADFVFFWAMNLPWAAQTIKAAPYAQLADGAIDVLVIRKRVSRWQLLRAFLTISDGTSASLPYVDYYKVRSLHLEPHTHPAVMAIDGEQVNYAPIWMEAMPAVGRVFCQ